MILQSTILGVSNFKDLRIRNFFRDQDFLARNPCSVFSFSVKIWDVCIHLFYPSFFFQKKTFLLSVLKQYYQRFTRLHRAHQLRLLKNSCNRVSKFLKKFDRSLLKGRIVKDVKKGVPNRLKIVDINFTLFTVAFSRYFNDILTFLSPLYIKNVQKSHNYSKMCPFAITDLHRYCPKIT